MFANNRDPCCRDRSQIRPSNTLKLHFCFEPDSSQTVRRQRNTRSDRFKHVTFTDASDTHVRLMYTVFTDVPNTSRNVVREHHPNHLHILTIPLVKPNADSKSSSANMISAQNTSHSNIVNSLQNIMLYCFLNRNYQKTIKNNFHKLLHQMFNMS